MGILYDMSGVILKHKISDNHISLFKKNLLSFTIQNDMIKHFKIVFIVLTVLCSTYT